MPIKKDDHQDDYYANISASSQHEDGGKKPIKLKLKVVAKKHPDDASEPSPQVEEKVVSVSQEENILHKKPQARLVEREHASE
jgi:hypothetical protein